MYISQNAAMVAITLELPVIWKNGYINTMRGMTQKHIHTVGDQWSWFMPQSFQM